MLSQSNVGETGGLGPCRREEAKCVLGSPPGDLCISYCRSLSKFSAVASQSVRNDAVCGLLRFAEASVVSVENVRRDQNLRGVFSAANIMRPNSWHFRPFQVQHFLLEELNVVTAKM